MLVGEYLKNIRLQKNLSLDNVAGDLKISIGYIKSIEEDNYSQLPIGPYAIGFIKSYSKYLGMDSIKITNEYKSQINVSNNFSKIEIPKPIENINLLNYSKAASFFLVILVSATFYYMFVDDFNYEPKYAITSEVPENLELEIEEFEVQIARSKLKDNNKKLDNNKIYQTKILTQDNSETNSVTSVLASRKVDENISTNLITISAIHPTWIQIRDKNDKIIFTKLLKINEEYTYLENDNLTLTSANAGNLIVSIGDKVIGKLGKKGEVLDSVIISLDYFSN